MLINELNLINPKYSSKLAYELWLEEWKKKHCQHCLINIPAPHNCYICYQQRKIGFCCAVCAKFTYYPASQICGGLYDTGSCFCASCQELIKKRLEKKNCACEFSLVGYSAGHSIHNYSSVINGFIKPLLKGSRSWIKLACRSCEKAIQSFKLNCACYLKQKEHQHQYSAEKCLSCAAGSYIQTLSAGDLQKKYQEYCQNWQEWAEFAAQKTIKQQYKYDGESYWTGCSFCRGWIKGQKTHQAPLQRNKVSFWTENKADERIICNNCLRKNKKVLKVLGIKGIKRQMLYNYRLRGLV